MDAHFTLAGIEEYIAQLQAQGGLIDPAADRAVEAGAQVVFDEMINLCPVGGSEDPHPGALKAHLEQTGKGPVTQGPEGPSVEVGLLDLGATGERYGKRRVRKGRKHARNVYPREFLYGIVLEYGKHNMAAQPYVRPAFDNTQGAVIAAEVASLKESGILG